MSRADKVSDRFPVVEELFRHPEIADRLPGAAVNRAFTVLTESTKGKGREQEGVRTRGHFRAVVCMPFAIAIRIR